MGKIQFFSSSALKKVVKAAALVSITFCTVAAIPVSAEGIPKVWESQKYQPPVGLGTPDHRSQGGTRSGATLAGTRSNTSNTARFIPLVPQSHNFGVTTSAYPSVLVYVSDYVKQTNVDTLEFLLLDEKGKEVYRARFAVDLDNQLLRIDLPQNSGLAPLEEGKDYLWLLEGFTQDLSLRESLFTHGWIRRVPPTATLMANLRTSQSTEDMANAYINERIWYDAIAKLEEGFTGRNISSEDRLVAQWRALLTAAGVEESALDAELMVAR